ncbi:unnamed protein product, partial [Prorocentrum cordatum]
SRRRGRHRARGVLRALLGGDAQEAQEAPTGGGPAGRLAGAACPGPRGQEHEGGRQVRQRGQADPRAEASTTQLVRRMGWFRDVRLRRLADSFMRSSKMHQQASSRENWETDRGMAKPSPQELAEYEEALKQHVLQAQSKFPGGADERQARDQRQGRRAWEGGRHQASRAEVPREGAGETAQVRHQGHDRGEEAEGQGGPEAEGQGRRRRPVSCTGFGGFAGCLSSSASSSFHPPPS